MYESSNPRIFVCRLDSTKTGKLVGKFLNQEGWNTLIVPTRFSSCRRTCHARNSSSSRSRTKSAGGYLLGWQQESRGEMAEVVVVDRED